MLYIMFNSGNEKNSKGNYIIISGNKDLSNNTYENYNKKIEPLNKNGEKVKIIIGSETAAEGLDFKYIREVHILDPWFHLNKANQIIGRGIRNCSHIDLEPEKRNVKIFMYASTKSLKPINENETLDLKIYREAEVKSRRIAEIENLLKISSVDCNLNIENHKYKDDVDFSRKCHYKKCDYKCQPKFKKISNINKDTINTDILKEKIKDVINKIKFGSLEPHLRRKLLQNRRNTKFSKDDKLVF